MVTVTKVRSLGAQQGPHIKWSFAVHEKHPQRQACSDLCGSSQALGG